MRLRGRRIPRTSLQGGEEGGGGQGGSGGGHVVGGRYVREGEESEERLRTVYCTLAMCL